MKRRVLRRELGMLVVAALGAGCVATASLAVEPAGRESEPVYLTRAARIEPSGAVLYRLDTATGAVCAFSFAQRPEGEPRGCLAGRDASTPGRFALDAVSGARGTSQSSAYRTDLVTGEICRFQLPAPSGSTLVAVGCVGAAAPADDRES